MYPQGRKGGTLREREREEGEEKEKTIPTRNPTENSDLSINQYKT